MKFPTVTVVLVSAALIFVVWEQTREQPEPIDASRFTRLASDPVERSAVLDYVTARIPELCEEAVGTSKGSEELSMCIESSGAREPACRRAMADRFPGIVASDAVFRDLSITMMSCLVPRSGLID
ncbi:hypothetical protein [Marinobacter salinus]|nr:hypothetical protein [Marinobacter salinus]